jgi:hypothetical protein
MPQPFLFYFIFSFPQRYHRESAKGKRGPKGSPRLKFAALQLANDPSLDTADALLNAGYRHVDITHAKRKAVSRQKLRFKQDIEKRNWQKVDHRYYITQEGKSKLLLAYHLL